MPDLALTLERVRRTTHVDGWTGAGGGLEVRAAARDLVRDADAARPVRSVELEAVLDDRRRVVELGATAPETDLSALTGAGVGPGFRARATEAIPDEEGLPLGVLVADLPTAVLLSGYAQIRAALERGAAAGSVVGPEVLGPMVDVCAGWREGGENVTSIAAGRGVPAESILGCPPAPPLRHPEYPLAWHDLPELPAGALRRARRIDVARARGEIVVDAFFRDTYFGRDGEVVLHEYSLCAWLDPDLTLLEIQATPRVLPFSECPFAAGQVGALVGANAVDLPEVVRDKLGGTAGCTHLNDLLAQLGHLPRLLELLP